MFLLLCNNADRLHAVTPLSLDRLPLKPEYEGQEVTRGVGCETHKDFLMPPILQPASPNKTTHPQTKTFPENDPPCREAKTRSECPTRDGNCYNF